MFMNSNCKWIYYEDSENFANQTESIDSYSGWCPVLPSTNYSMRLLPKQTANEISFNGQMMIQRKEWNCQNHNSFEYILIFCFCPFFVFCFCLKIRTRPIKKHLSFCLFFEENQTKILSENKCFCPFFRKRDKNILV